MVRDYKDHSSMGSSRAQRFMARLVVAVLLVTVGVLGYSYWALLTSHRDATARLTLVKADLDSALAARSEMGKVMDSCKGELKQSGEERKLLKDSEATLTGQVKELEEKQKRFEDEKASLKETMDKEIATCKETSKQEVSKCNDSCGQKIEEAKKSAAETCQREKSQQNAVAAGSQQGNESAKIVNPNESNVGGT